MPWLVVLDGQGYISRCKGIKREFKIFLQVIFRQGLQILLMSGVRVTSASQILESFWNIWSQVSQRNKQFYLIFLNKFLTLLLCYSV